MGRHPAAMGLVDRRVAGTRLPDRPPGALTRVRRSRQLYGRGRRTDAGSRRVSRRFGTRRLQRLRCSTRVFLPGTMRSKRRRGGLPTARWSFAATGRFAAPSSLPAVFRSSSQTTTTRTSTTRRSSCLRSASRPATGSKAPASAGSRGRSGCRAVTAAGEHSTSRTRAASPRGFRFATSARSPIRRARTSPRTWSSSWLAKTVPTAPARPLSGLASSTCFGTRRRTAPGSGVGARTTSTASAPSCPRSRRAGSRSTRACDARSPGSRGCRTTTVGSARICARTATPTGAAAARRPRRRPHGPCSRSTPPGEDGDAVERAVGWLVDSQRPDGGWDEPYLHGHRIPGRLLPQLPSLPAGVPGDGARPDPEGREMKGPLLVFVPLRVEAVALGRRPGWRVLRSGMGPARARIAAARGLGVEGAVRRGRGGRLRCGVARARAG